MKMLHNNKFVKLLQAPMAILISSNLLLLSNCSNAFNPTIQFANFESYMSQDLINNLSHNYNIQFPYYTTNEVIETKFADYYDIAIPSCYQMLVLQQKGMLEKINWSLFGIKNINNAQQAKSLFNEELIDTINDWVIKWTTDPKHNFKEPINNILDYCIPYFAQSLMFAYKGPQQTFYHSNNQPIDNENEITWDDIFYTFSPSSPIADFFKPQKNQRCAMLDDCRSIYDTARIIDTNNDTNEPNPNFTIDDAKKTYECITKYFKNYVGNSWMQIQTDSGIIATNLSNHNSGYLSAITWSGDILYAAMGAGEFDSWDAKDFHIVKPLGGATLNEMDVIVINKQSKKDMNIIYSIIKQVALDGCEINNEEELFVKNEKDQYKYWTIQNFDAVGYTPVLKNIYDSVIGDSCPYWEDIENETTKKMYQRIIKNESGKKALFGKPLTDIQNSNIHWAWLESKEKF